jgi:hypothetical protein
MFVFEVTFLNAHVADNENGELLFEAVVVWQFSACWSRNRLALGVTLSAALKTGL